MHNDHHLHLLHYDVAQKRDLYISTALRIMGVQLVGVFVPALLYHDLGVALSGIFLFYGIWSTGIAVLVYRVTARLVSKYGTKIGMFVGIPFLVLMYVCLHLLPSYPWLLPLLALCGSIFTAFFRVGFHTDISQSARNKSFGSKIALLHIIITLVGAITPFFGGMFLDSLGLQVTMYIGACLLLLSLLPLLHSEKYHKPVPYDHKKFTRLINRNRGKLAFLTFSAQTQTRLVGNILWPLVIYILIEDYTKLGLITMVATITVVVILYIGGRYADRHQEDKVMAVNLSLQATNWIVGIGLLGSSLLTPVLISLVDVFNKLTMQLNGTLIGKVMYEFANNTKENPVYITSLHEISNHVSRAVLCYIFALIFWLSGEQIIFLVVPFAFGLLTIPLQYLIFRKKQDK